MGVRSSLDSLFKTKVSLAMKRIIGANSLMVLHAML